MLTLFVPAARFGFDGGQQLIWLSKAPKSLPVCRPSPGPWLFLLDRDGVLNEDVGAPGVIRRQQFQMIKGAAAAVDKIVGSGHACKIVTNQSCIQKGLATREMIDKMHEEDLLSLLGDGGPRGCLGLADVYVADGRAEQGAGPGSPPDSLQGSYRLKPAPDLLAAAMRASGTPAERTIMVGDNLTDLEAAGAAGVAAAVLVTSSAHGRRAEKFLLAQGGVLSSFPDLPIGVSPSLCGAVSALC